MAMTSPRHTLVCAHLEVDHDRVCVSVDDLAVRLIAVGLGVCALDLQPCTHAGRQAGRVRGAVCMCAEPTGTQACRRPG